MDSLSKSGEFFLFFSFFSKKYGECSGSSFLKFLPITLGFFWLPVGEISPKRKKNAAV